jgi:hypothetical protein
MKVESILLRYIGGDDDEQNAHGEFEKERQCLELYNKNFPHVCILQGEQ